MEQNDKNIVGAISSSINIPYGYIFNYGKLIKKNKTRTKHPIINRIVYNPNKSLKTWKKYLIIGINDKTVKFYKKASKYILSNNKKDFQLKRTNLEQNDFFEINWDLFIPKFYDSELILTVVEIDNGIRGRQREIRIPLNRFNINDLNVLIQAEIDNINTNFTISDKQLLVLTWRNTDPIESGTQNDIILIDDEEMFGNAIIYHNVVGKVPNIEFLTNHCVYDSLLHMYSKTTLKRLTKEKLLQIFDKKNFIDGVSTNDVKTFCEKYNIFMRVIDIQGEIVFTYNPDHFSNKHQKLVYLYSNHHMQLITDKVKRNAVTTQVRTKCNYKSPKKTFCIDLEQNKDKKIILQEIETADLPKLRTNYPEKELIIVLYNSVCLRNTFIELINTENVSYQNTCVNDKMTEICYNEKSPKIILKGTDQPEIAIYLNNCNETTENCLNVSKLNNDLYSKYTDLEIKSELNSTTFDIFSNMNNIIQKKFSDIDETSRTFDINKCHSSAIMNIDEDFPIYTVLDYPEPFKYTNQILPTGFYYVKETNLELLSIGWKSSVELNYFIKNKYKIGEISYQLLPSRLVPKDHFKDYIQDIYNNFGEFSKSIANVFIGGLGKTKAKYSTIDVSRDKDDVIRTKFKNKEHSKHNCISKEGELWINNNRSIYDLLYTSCPIYHFIVGNANKSANLLRNRLGGELVYCKTDAICVKGNFNEIETTFDGIGTIKEERVDKHFGILVEIKHKIQEFSLNIKEIEQIDENSYLNKHLGKSLLITGLGGCGKTFLTKKIIKELELLNQNLVLLAPTNKAANILGGNTISSYFSLFLNNKKPSNMFKLVHKIDYFIIDEISMNTREFWFVLHYAKYIKNSLKFILIGDINQLPAVEDYNYINCPNYVENGMSFLVEKRINLTENKRGDILLTEISKKILKHIKLDEKFFKNTENIRNIVYTNKKRKELNKQIGIEEYNKEKNKNDKISLKFENLEQNSQYQNLYLVNGTPVIACKTKKHLNYANSEFFVIIEINLEKELLVLGNGTQKDIKLINITFKDFKDSFLMNYATTVYKCQGDTFNYPFTIHEWKMMDKNMKYTAFSRTTNIDNVSIIN